MQYRNAPDGAVIVPELPDGRLLMLGIRRYAFDEDSLEFPRGGAKDGEREEDAALRELWEETGLQPAKLIAIGHCRPDTSILRVDATVYVAKLAASAEKAVQVQEQEAIHGYAWMTGDEILRTAAAGGVRDGFSLSAFTLYLAYKLENATVEEG
jgi:ADP-ribose pyrophosphatase